jgi:hypothetical protein
VHVPEPSHTSAVQALPSRSQVVDGASKKHAGEQQSFWSALPSSHCSSGWTTPSPHVVLPKRTSTIRRSLT